MRRRSFQLVALGLLGLALAGCRQDMHDQPKYIPMRASDFYPDKRSQRPYVEGTVARGDFNDGSPLYTGVANGGPIGYFPMKITEADMKRGQERYNIYCAPCHGVLGDGNGIIVQRGFRQAASFHIERLRTTPPGHYVDVMRTGFGAMPDYNHIPAQDKWRIAAYIRALQLSQHATVNDVPEAQRGQIKRLSDVQKEVEHQPASGATLPQKTEVPR